MAKFRCNYTGNVFEFKLEHDVKTMREHPDYTEIKEEEIKKPSKKSKVEDNTHGNL